MVIITWAALCEFHSIQPKKAILFYVFNSLKLFPLSHLSMKSNRNCPLISRKLLPLTLRFFSATSQWLLEVENWRNNYICLLQSRFFFSLQYVAELISRPCGKKTWISLVWAESCWQVKRGSKTHTAVSIYLCIGVGHVEIGYALAQCCLLDV